MNARDTSPYSFEMIETQEALIGLRPRWESLMLSVKHAGLFSRWDWNFTWWQNFSEKGDQLLVVWAECNGEPFGLAPLFLRRSRYYGMPRRLLRFIGEGHSDRADILVSEPDPAFYTALFDFLAKRAVWDVIYLREIPKESGLFNWARISGIPTYIEKDSECPFIPFSIGMTPESFRSSLSRKTRAEFRNRANRLQRIGESIVRHRVLDDPDDPVLDCIRDIEMSSSKANREINLVFSPESNFVFQKKLLGQISGSVQPLLTTLEVKGKIIAYLYGFIADKVYHAYNTAFLSAYAHLSPGKLLIQEAIEYCNREGLREFDFLRGNSYIKSKWTDRYRKHLRLTVFRNTLLNRLHAWMIFTLRPELKPLLGQLRKRLAAS
jgi:CelD/BcsL family acetyltransferase involved in cellulose biosynthesis